MYNLFITLNDWVNSGFKPEFLDIIGLIAIFFAISVITIKNPISSLMSLIGLFGTVSVYLILIGLNFIGFSYLIVYIGAISILFLFILMLIDIRTSELLSNNINSIPLALFVIILLSYSWNEVSPELTNGFNGTDNITSNLVYTNLLLDLENLWESLYTSGDNTVMFVSSNNWDGNIAETSHIAAIGMVLYTSFNIWLLIVSLILLLAMVGSLSIVK